MARYFIFLILFSASASSAAVKSINKNFFIKLVSEADTYYLNMYPSQTEGDKIIYRPNTSVVNGAEFGLFGLTLSYKTKGSALDETKYGKTEYTDYRLSLSLGKEDQYFIQGYSNSYKGLYISNTSDVDTTVAADMRLQRSDLKVSGQGLSVTYVFSPKSFSLAAAQNQSKIQNTDGWSILASLAYDGVEISGDSAIVPVQEQATYGVDNQMSKANFTSATASLGIGFTGVQKHGYFFSTVLMAGAGQQQRKYGTAAQSTTSNTNTEKLSGMVAIGQNNEKFLFGFVGSIDQTTLKTESIKFISELTAMKVFIGLRF